MTYLSDCNIGQSKNCTFIFATSDTIQRLNFILISRSFGNWFCFLLQAKGVTGRSYSEKQVMIEAVPIMKYHVIKQYEGVKDMPTLS